MDSGDGSKQQLHVVMFPWLAFGHIIPYLELSKSIAEKGHKVSFLSTSRNILRLPHLPSHLSPLITLIKLKLPYVPELPADAEATMDISTDQMPFLKKAFDALQPQLTSFLESNSPDWIIYDFAPYWLPSIAAGFSISRAFFSIVPSWFIDFLGPSYEAMIDGIDDRKTVDDFIVPPKWIPFPTTVCYRKHEANWMVGGSSSQNASGVSDVYRLGMVLKGSDVILIRDCYEIESKWLTLMEDMHRIPVVPVGLMPPNVVIEKNDATIKNWLDGQVKGHVVYVALGSEVVLNKTQLSELALGLELSGLPFFWVLRKSSGSIESHSMELPEGFLERTKKRGLVWTSWVPQLQILSHESVGGFLTHCGWGSIMEGLMFGHPLIMLPFLVDQGLNARLFVEKQVGVEVSRNEEDGSFTKDSVADSLSSVFVKDEGRIYKAKAMEMSGMFGDTELHKRYVEDCIDYMVKQRGIAKSS